MKVNKYLKTTLMKKLKTLFFILITTSLNAQWAQQNFWPLENLNDLYCITEDIVVVVGNAGTIFKTTDGGTNWLQKKANTSQDLKRVQFVNSNIGFAVGNTGTLIKTTDGGENWVTIPTGITNNILGLSCLDENVFFISSETGLMKSINGGDTFQTLNNPNSEIVDTIQFFNNLSGYASNLNALYKTTDGGSTWGIIHQNDVFSFYFFNENIGFVNATDGLSKTIDGGVNFNYLTSISSLQYKLFATTENIIWGAPVFCLLNGDPCYSTRLEITETGVLQREDYDPPFQTLHFSNQTTGYAIAYGSAIFKNTTGTLSIENQINQNYNVQIVPNPASEKISISFANNLNIDFSIEINDNLGKTIFLNSYQGVNQTTINTDSFAKGLYFLTIYNQEKRETHKLIIT